MGIILRCMEGSCSWGITACNALTAGVISRDHLSEMGHKVVAYYAGEGKPHGFLYQNGATHIGKTPKQEREAKNAQPD